MIRAALRRKEVPYVGKGTNTWNNVHIKDLQALYLLVIKHALEARANKVQVESYENFYFGSVGSHEWGAVSKALAPLLYEKSTSLLLCASHPESGIHILNRTGNEARSRIGPGW